LGTLRVGVAGALPSASPLQIAGGNLDLNGLGISAASLFGSGGAVNGGGTLTVTTSGTETFTGTIENGTRLHMAGEGNQTLAGSANNSNGWASVSAGTLVLAKTSSAAVHAVGRTNATALTIAGGIARLGGSGNDQIQSTSDVSISGGVFDLHGTNEGFRGLVGSGGEVRNDSPLTTSKLTLGEGGLEGVAYAYNGSIKDGTGVVAIEKTGAGIQIFNGEASHIGGTTIAQGELRVNGTHFGGIEISNEGVLSGSGLVSGAVSSTSPITIAPGDDLGVLTIGGSDVEGKLAIDLDGSIADQLCVLGDLDLRKLSLHVSALAGGLTSPVYVIASYGSLTGSSFLNANVPSDYKIDYDYQGGNQIALVQTSTAFRLWAIAKSLPAGSNGPHDDPDGDGLSNLGEFAYDDDPLSSVSLRKISSGVHSFNGEDALLISLPVRDGAIFDGLTSINSNSIDGVSYLIEASEDLLSWVLAVTELIGMEAEPFHQDLPPLSDGWSYRTFRVAGGPSSASQQFIRASAK
jgi:autotransporter-associated beta strand protein